MDPEDTNVYASNIIEKYENRPDDLGQMCLADFVSNYDYPNKSYNSTEDCDDIESYTVPVTTINDDITGSQKIINLKSGFGKMRKRNKS